ncbi:hypothetical protein TELCIR_22378 [Teladorsagia circumcincta]|uniref:Uncharacterized protein n=1 Tax=Teladorsagia circumcincta TaxID=45464 RepID=A0A2G9TE37_TELCI|nr:hypothetical protein TELCIR_22378 [Teladorsagia circumcincta]
MSTGCGNGGAQIRADTAEDREHILSKVEESYATLQGDATQQMREVASEWSRLNPSWNKLLYTDYHGVTGNIAQKLQW